MKKCLMIKTKDQKKFFTHEENLPELIQFSKVFRAEISIVRIPEEAEVLSLKELAPALCEKRQQKTNYTIIKIINKKKNRQKILKRAITIQDTIKNLLISNQIISLKQLNKKLKKYKLTTACICNHFKIARKSLEDQGYQITKTGFGRYKIN